MVKIIITLEAKINRIKHAKVVDNKWLQDMRIKIREGVTNGS